MSATGWLASQRIIRGADQVRWACDLLHRRHREHCVSARGCAVLNEWVLTGSSWTGGMAWTLTTTAATCVYSQHCQSHLKRQADDIRIHLVRAQNMPFNYQGSKPLLGFKIAAFMISGFRCVEVVIVQSVWAKSALLP